MEYKIIIRLADFYLSFLPFWISAAILNGYKVFVNKENSTISKYWLVITSLLFLVSLGVFYQFIHPHKDSGTRKFKLLRVREEKIVSSEYLISVVLPLCTFDVTEAIGIILFIVYFVFLGWLSIMHKRLNSSVVLEMMGYRLYNSEISNDDNKAINRIIVSRENLTLKIGEIAYLKTINDETLLCINAK